MALLRNVRHRSFGRIRHGRKTLAFLGERADALEDTGSSVGFTAVAPLAAVAASQALAFSGNANDGGTVTIGAVVYTFVTASPSDVFEVLVGDTTADSIDNLVAAINAGDGEGSEYGEGTTAHPSVSAEVGIGTIMIVTARVPGAAGNAIGTTETLSDGVWGGATLTGGANAVLPSPVLTSVAHGLSVGEGPFIAESSGELPPGMEGHFFWVREVLSADTFTVTTVRGGAVFVPQGAGSGTRELTKADSQPAILEYLRQNPLEVVAAADDVDDL